MYFRYIPTWPLQVRSDDENGTLGDRSVGGLLQHFRQDVSQPQALRLAYHDFRGHAGFSAGGRSQSNRKDRKGIRISPYNLVSGMRGLTPDSPLSH